MAMIRDVIVGFQGANRKIEQIGATIPADWVSGDRDALFEVYNNAKLRTRISVAPNSAIWAQITEPYDDAPRSVRFHG